MARLVLNDIRLNAVGFMVIFVMFNFFLVFMSANSMLSYALTRGGSAGLYFASLMVLYVFLHEARNKGQIVYRSLPLGHVKIVASRYLSILVIFLACTMYGHLFQQIILRFSPPQPWPFTYQNDSGYALEHSLIARGIAVSLIIGVAIPLIMRFSIPVTGILVGYLVSGFVYPRLVYSFMDYSLHASFFLGLSRWSAFAIVLIVAINVIAFRISIWLYGQRQL